MTNDKHTDKGAGADAGGKPAPSGEAMRELLDRELMAQARAGMAAPAPTQAQPASVAPTLDLRLERDVIRIASEALGMPEERLDPTGNLSSLGIDSIAITEVMVRISRFLGISIAPTTFFEARHLDDLSAILRARYGEAIASRYAAVERAPATVPAAGPVPTQAPAPGAPGRRDVARPLDVASWLSRHRARHGGRPARASTDASAPLPVPSPAPASTGAAAPVAILSMEGMFPRSRDLAALEEHLRHGDDCMEEVPLERWDWRAVDGDPRKGPYTDVRHGGFVTGHDRFDAAFFNISPKEAELIDPQHRLFIECVWKLIEGAGYAPGSLAGRKVGIFVGINLQDYADMVNRSGLMDAVQMTGLGHAFLPNRISHMLDVNGPSQVIDTACSSSLVAIHRAVMSIRHEGCEMAIAGGANLMLTPTQHIMFSKVGMLSIDGRCKAFGSGANGYARADGVGAVLLKRLDLAERDGDRILGVIRGSVENHGGAASSLTAPNLKAQAQLIVAAHREAGTDPRTVSMIECHGTGTPLGDPIEIDGLKTAFAELYRDWGLAAPPSPHCGIGSVKSNIGHAETAAGVAGLIKVLLAMQSGVLYRSLHCETPNPLIGLDGSPFYLLSRERTWNRPVVDGIEAPRRAGVSSFGAGGVIAHLVVEEYRPEPAPDAGDGSGSDSAPRSMHVVPLSAQSESALREAALLLRAHLGRCGQLRHAQLSDLAYTLQIGRDEMRVRLACAVADSGELARQLDAFIGGDRTAVAYGVIGRGRRAATAPLDPAAGGLGASEIAAGWVAGAVVDWKRAHAQARPRRVALPVYPFAGKRYWLPEPEPFVPDLSVQPSARAGALKMREIAPGRFVVDLQGTEFFLADHRVQGNPVLPGVAYLELSCAAAMRSGIEVLRIKQVVWLKTLVVTAPLAVEVALVRDGSGWARIEISSTDAQGGRQLHGQARVADATAEQAPRSQQDEIGGAAGRLAALRDSHPRSYSSDHVYRVFDAMQIHYGPAHRAIRSLALGIDSAGRTQVLARLRLPDVVSGTLAGFTLHPSLLDGAFQAALGMGLDRDGNASEAAALPFALDALEVLGPCSPDMWVHVRRPEGDDASARVRTLDLDLMDEGGDVRVRMRGFATRILDPRPAQATMLFEPQWHRIEPVDAHGPGAVNPMEFEHRLALLCECGALTADSLGKWLPGWTSRALVADHEGLDQRFAAYARQLLRELQRLVAGAQRPARPVLVQVVIPDRSDALPLSGLSGLLRTAALEHPWLWCQLVAVDPALDARALAACLAGDAKAPQRARLRHRGEDAHVLAWHAAGQSGDGVVAPRPWREGGVYLITGGAGALGQRIAREIALHAREAAVILVGRSALDRERGDWLASIAASGASIAYQRVDIGDARAVATLVAGIRERHGRLDGVVHAAGLLQDASLAQKTEAQLAEVLDPKVSGVENLDRAIGAGQLDFFVLFASIAGVFGNPGQADYAAANAYLDGFAAARESLREKGARHGRTLAIDWPLWQEGGMRVDEATNRLMRQTTGMAALDTSDGLLAMYRALASDVPQVLVVAGDCVRVRQRVLALDDGAPPLFEVTRAEHAAGAPGAGSSADHPPESPELRSRIQGALMRIAGTRLKVAQDDLDPDVELSEYGFDSIGFTQFANEINERFDLEITPTLFFERPTLAELAAHLARAHGAAMAAHLGIVPPASKAATAAVPQPSPAPVARQAVPDRPAAEKDGKPAVAIVGAKPAVAIIGMSGVFPMAPDIDAFWQNLVEGRDCIGEVPAERWDWRAYWGDPATEAGRTNVKWGGFIDGIAEFDPGFFGISPREASLMDPQQRLLLTQAWRVIEDAGYAPRSLSGSNTGVFVGTADSGYGRLIAATGTSVEGYSMTGLAPSLGPNRISFFLDLHGPSVAVETACSSALVAIHRAVESIASGGCDAAIAGGINTLLLPDAFIGFSKAGMLAPDGRCKPFSAAANGYARGEGVGLVFLKRLEDAERDGDRILAVIRASAENHGGRASSLTAPNPKAQADLLRNAYGRAGFDARTVSYVEAHGTGTPLGDPIEMEALSSAFDDLGRRADGERGPAPAVRCAIGSVKSNIGHLELAAGAAGVIKVLLQMKHRLMVKTLHCDQLNPYLKLDGDRFFVLRENQPWLPVDATGKSVPRRAGVSSFGFGGANAHVVLEEYLPVKVPAAADETPAGPAMIVLSARTAEQLRESARQLCDALNDAMPLADLAFTLQTGRDAMEHRLAFVAESLAQVRARLQAFVDGREEDGLRVGQVKPNRETLAALDADEEVRRSLAGLPERGKHDVLLRLWVKGLAFDWRSLHRQSGRDTSARRIALPGYPFARTRYWVGQKAGAMDAGVRKDPARRLPHPLLQEDISDATHHRYASVFDGREAFLRDHQVGGRLVLPGVACLEMARAALSRMGIAQGDIELSQHVWLRPLVVGAAALRLEIALQASEDGGIAYRITSEGPDGPCVHSQGLGVVRAASGRPAPSHDLPALRTLTPRLLDIEACYRTFAALGLEYGHAHRSLRELRVGDDVVLARLTLPDGMGEDGYGLHPSLLDGALQAILGLAPEGEPGAALPYALRRLDMFGATLPAMWAVVRREGRDQEGSASYAIDLCDDAGLVRVRLEGFALRATGVAKAAAVPRRIAQGMPSGSVDAEASSPGAEDRVARALQALVRIAAGTLEVDAAALEPDTELGEYGFDSITMTGFASRTNAELGLALTPADFFEFATLDRLARHIAGEPCFDLPARQPALPAQDDDPIAIVGISCCFPMAQDAGAFWDNLLRGKDCISGIPADRWDWRAVDGDPKVETNKTNIHWAGFIDGVFEFDPLFFGISPREASLMDPQQRLLLQHVWKAIEDSGHSPRSLAGRSVGLFVGTSSSGYREIIGEETGGDGYVATGAVPSVGPNRASYFLDWHGPSEPVETACSSSLVAVHRALQAMRAGDCEMAVAGGVNTIITPEAHISFAKAGMLSPDGRCKTFSSKANGYVRGEGVGMLVLKRLSAAERDGDPVYALIRGSAINHGGRANSLTAPNTAAQAELLKTAYARAGIDPRTLGYVEAHGTGTALGDPVEVNALKSAFRELAARALGDQPAVPAGEGAHCGIGSVKSNIGHLELASGVAGVIKVLMQMRHRTLVASLHCEEQNPYIDLTASPFFIVRENQPWQARHDASGRELPRRAGVSSFGFGGVNAHVILEEYRPPHRDGVESAGPAVVPLSARDPERLRDQARSLVAAIDGGRLGRVRLHDLAYTLQVGREPMKHRLALEVRSIDELRDRLQAFLQGQADAASIGKVGPGPVPPALGSPAEAWVRGAQVDWARLHDGEARRVHLPTYPFARERYRIGAGQATPALVPVGDTVTVEVRLDADAFYLRDHLIKGARILPGAASLELVRAAFIRLDGGSRATPVLLSQIVWRQPLIVAEAPVTAYIALEPDAARGKSFQLRTGAADGSGSGTVHVQGKVGGASDAAAPDPVALHALRARCPASVGADWLYATYASLGLEYGPTLRVVAEMFRGQGELLARLELPQALLATQADFGLHPAMLDAAFQACLGLLWNDGPQGTALPFSIERLAVIAPTTASMWACVRELPASGAVRKLDIDLADAQGSVCVQIRGFAVRLLGTVPAIETRAPAPVAHRAAAVRYFAQLVAAESGMAVEAIEADAPLEAYGIDSMMITVLTDRLERDFGPLSKTLFFEHQTLDAIVDHFLEAHGERLAEVTGAGSPVPAHAGAVKARTGPGSVRAPAPPGSGKAIAIIGLAGRYPAARTVGEFWNNLAAGRDCITEVPATRWDHGKLYDPVRGKPGKSNSKWGGFIDDFDCFDPLFFNISPREAQYIDPQERIFLQCAWEALEDAGYTRATLAPGDPLLPGGNVGVFVGVMYEEYQLYGAEMTQRGQPMALSGSAASIANRVSYFCNFHGPSMAVDSMCSSSLTSIHLACESLLAGSCEVALAGGVNLSLHPNKYLALGQGRFTSSNGRCESFGRGGDGYVPGEGVGAVLLKPLDRALADGDQIYGVIRGSALNHGGKTNGYPVPNPVAQAAVIEHALARAGVDPRTVSYLEAHGTGTTLGDPIEIAALARAFRRHTDAREYCAIGSVKSNIGHCESAAGIAGLTKVLLQMKHRQLVPSLHSETLNAGIDFASSPFVVQRQLAPWKRPLIETPGGVREVPRIAGLSSFGAGGSNAHFVIEEYVAAANVPELPPLAGFGRGWPGAFPLSARDGQRLDEAARRLLATLAIADDDALPAVAHVLQQGREGFEARLAVVAADRSTLMRRLEQLLAGEAGLPGVHCGGGYRAGQVAEARHVAMPQGSSEPDRMAARWVQGEKTDWSLLRNGSPPPRKVSLPGYPFARERCWIPGSDVAQAPIAAVESVSGNQPGQALLFAPRWEAKAASADQQPAQRTIIALCDFASGTASGLAAQLAPAECVVFENADPQIAVRFEFYAVQVLGLLQRIFRERPAVALLQVVVPVDGERVLLEGLGGLLRTAQLEHPALRCQLIGFASLPPDPASLLWQDRQSGDTQIRYDASQRLVRRWRELAQGAMPSGPAGRVDGPWKDGGVYLITGGAGGLGLLLAEEIARSVHQPVLCVTGRSALQPAASARLDALRARVIHRRADVTRLEDVRAVVSELRSTFGRLDGIVHAAGMTCDKFLLRKSPAELREVLAPKVSGLMNLDAASAECELGFLLLFASASGALGNPGQADYAAANAFMDAFAQLRNQRVASGERRGLTLSIDWPYWQDGGMRLDATTLAAMRDGYGLAPLEATSGMRALRAGVQSGEAQVLVLDGDHAMLRRMMQPVAGPARERVAPVAAAASSASAKSLLPEPALRQKTVEYVSMHIANVLRIPVERLAPREPFDRYGIDSVLALQIIDELERDLGKLPVTLLFECPQIVLLADALLQTHAARLQALLDPDEPPASGGTRSATQSHGPEGNAPGDSGARGQDIAVIAVAGRYPGADTIEAFWDVLREGRDCVTEIPPERWDHARIHSQEKGKPGTSYCKWGGFLSDVDCFDPGFFGITKRAAALMDPQERLFLQTVWHLLERGAHTRERLREHYESRVGVYVGAMYQHYASFDADADSKALLSLSSYASIANRVSFFYDLQGPSVAIDTMCSSGLQAVHLACQSLQRGECRLAIAGGVNLSIHPNKYLGLSRAGMLGSHAQSRSFADGDGYLPAEGVGAVLLKPLAQALRDGDNVIAVIRGSAANHGGHSAGYAVPNMEVQARLIADNFRASGMDPRSVGYVEAAANGSALGDAIEVRALARAFGAFTQDTRFCAIGSVKSNMGHAEAASGMAQLTKVLLQLEHAQLVPSIGAGARNPNVHFDETPFVPQSLLAAWVRPHVNGVECPLRATVSSFGAGGSNVHLILEERPRAPGSGNDIAIAAPMAQGPRRFVFSAQDEDRLAELLKLMHDFVLEDPDICLARLSHTLRMGREEMACRFDCVASDREELLARLAAERPWQRAADAGEMRRRAQAAEEDDTGTLAPLVLPGYPFARERYWIAPELPVVSPVTSATPVVAGGTHEFRHVLSLITTLMGEELGISARDVDPKGSFREQGADSMFSLRLVHAMLDELGVRLMHRDIEKHASPDALAGYVMERLVAGVGQASPEAPAAGRHPGGMSPGRMPLAQGQTGLWVLQRLYPASSAYNVPLAFRVAGIGLSALEHACRHVLESFPILCTRIDDAGAQPCMVAHEIGQPLEVVTAPQQCEPLAFARSRAMRPFDLAGEPPIRFELLRCHEEILLIVVHHIVFDGVSALVLMSTFWDAYERFATGGTAQHRVPQAEFADYIEWERRHLRSSAGMSELAYWKRQLAGDLPVLQIPGDRHPDPARAVIGQSLDVVLDPERARAARKCAGALGINASVFFLGVLNILLYRYGGQEDILVGVPAMARPERRFERTVGYFANVMPIRATVSGSIEAATLLRQLHETLTEGLDHAAYPLAALVRDLGRKPDGQPLYQVSFAYQNFVDDQLRGPLATACGAVITHLPALRQEGDGVFGLELFEEGEQVRIVAGFDAGQFDVSTVRRMLDHFMRLVEAVSAQPNARVGALNMMSSAERERTLAHWSRGARLPVREGMVQQWIASQAARAPDAIAVVAGEQRLSYRDLMMRSEHLAEHLRGRGVGPDMPVAVLLERGVQGIVALLAVLKAGAAWVPLDAQCPEQRLSMILADLGRCAVILDASTQGRMAALEHPAALVVHIDRDEKVIGRRRANRHAVPVSPESTAYVIYTSGSTGRPKGVEVTHRAIAGHCLAVIDRYGLGAQDVVLQFASHSVDAALEQILPALVCGARLILREAELWSPDGFRSVLATHGVTVADIPPAYLRELLQAWAADPEQAPRSSPRMLIVGGEVLPPETVRLWQSGPFAGARLLNAYGPTEATITSTVHEVSAEAPGLTIPIGRPLAGGEVYILDRDGNPVPEGVPGELHIGGMRVAQAYRGLPALTGERFVPNPFASVGESGQAQACLYRTGDLASFVPGSDGVIAFRGRLDHQVKIRGFRIEPGDIEAALRDFGLRDAVVIAHAAPNGEHSLTACVVRQATGEDAPRADPRSLSAFLATRLPPYMLPAAYVFLDALPMTPGGKQDRAALRLVAASHGGDAGIRDAVAPRDAMEERLAMLWGQACGRDVPGVFEDFFMCGGHSLAAVRLLAAIRREFAQDLSIAELLRAPTIAQQAQILRERIEVAAPSALVLLRGAGGAEPLFCIHPVGGNVICYVELARGLDIDRPIYGLQSPALDGGPQPAGLEAMAATYVAALREVQPSGPYHLAGWSLGGVIAFEMAQQLRLAGEAVAFLALIDSYAPALLEAMETHRTPSGDDVDAQLAERSGRLLEVFKANMLALRDYRPQPYAGPVTLCCASEHRPADATLGWRKLVLGELTTHELRGNHYSVLKAPELGRLIAILAGHLQAAPSQRP